MRLTVVTYSSLLITPVIGLLLCTPKYLAGAMSLGEVVQAAAAFYKLPTDAITAFHDELDLVPGKLRVKRGGGAAGHNGLRSMDRQLGSPDYWRVRMGIGHPGSKDRVMPYVLGDFSKSDVDWLVPFLDAIADAAPMLAAGKQADFMTRVAFLTQADERGPG